MTHPRRAAALLLLTAICAVSLSCSPDSHGLGIAATATATPSVGSKVTVDWLTPELLQASPGAAGSIDRSKYLIFRLAVDSIPDKLSMRDLKGMVFLNDGGEKEYGTPVWTPIDGEIVLAGFPNRDARANPVPAASSRYLEIVIRGLGEEKRFRWDVGR